MHTPKYLYGAAVQGIQNFIFQTNDLRDIVGASELVANICDRKFEEVVGDGFATYSDNRQYGSVLHAAGNIKYVFADKDECARVVRQFPKIVSTMAPGITISQAVVEWKDGDFAKAVDTLENKLRIQRNKPMRNAVTGLMGIEHSRHTGLPVSHLISNDKLKYLDDATFAKVYEDSEEKKKSTLKLCHEAFCGTEDERKSINESVVAFDTGDLTKENSWIAIIHADGNGLGQIVQKRGGDPLKFSAFSANLDKATKEAAVIAYKTLCGNVEYNNKNRIPIRPIVLGGDDLTVICRADLAVDYAKIFIEKFEELTARYLDEKLTACAGIAFIKESFPFYYGYQMAEALCSRAKNDAKDSDSIRQGNELPQSCLMFYKVQDSYIENYNQMSLRELQSKDKKISFEFGPYYLYPKDARWTVEELLDKTDILNNKDDKEANAIKSHLRKWISIMLDNTERAEQYLNRFSSLVKGSTMKAFINEVTKPSHEFDRDDHQAFPVYDILALHTINTQKTKK